MRKNAIFYFTGTGNSLNAARNIAKKLGDCDVFFMPAYTERKILAGYERIDFVFPVYAGGPPLYVQKFIKETDFTLSKDAYFFTVATYGGIQGNAFYLLNELLEKQGINLDACFGINMRPNYIVEYDMPKIIYKLSKNSEQKIKITADKIVQKENTSIPKRKIKLLYIMNQKFTTKYNNMDKDYNVSENCTGCGLCSKVCPVENIEMSNGIPTFKHRCEQCVACIQVCPQKALNYKNKTQKRKRYINPNITVKDLIIQKNNFRKSYSIN